MKRDIDLIREILLRIEADESLEAVDGYSSKQVGYHVSLLDGAGLLTQEIYSSVWMNHPMLDGIRLTWSGHEFLDSSRSKTMWEKAKSITLEKTGTISFEILKSVLIQLAKRAVDEIAA